MLSELQAARGRWLKVNPDGLGPVVYGDIGSPDGPVTPFDPAIQKVRDAISEIETAVAVTNALFAMADLQRRAFGEKPLNYHIEIKTLDASDPKWGKMFKNVRAIKSIGATIVVVVVTDGAGRLVSLIPAAGVTPTREGLIEISHHLSTFEADATNAAMYARITAVFERGGTLTGADAAFYQHELIESGLMNAGMEARAAHLQTLAIQGIEYLPGYEALLFDASVIRQYPEYFSPAAKSAAGVTP